ncbi:ABC transporter substrate-binding protein [Vallitalea maricola]|uniref:Sugar ABC transporter substrate-binding protein n=1 Tax=Vallitalea maricola TaxID=3074433 RepID=A0ACB5UPV5_9FIRM|nr:sugar ABC transporter substrate-binding protein [Vallitalea sp. AN17-2]
MKKIISLLLVLIMVISVGLTACNNSSKKDEANKNEVTTSEKIDDKELQAPVKIRVAYYAAGQATQTMQKIVDEFMAENPNIEVETIQSNWSGHYERLKAELAAGAAPEVFLLDGVYIPQYAERGVLEDITERASGLDENKFLGIKQLRTPEGKLFGIPQGIQVDVLYYNKDMFDEAGVDYPTADWTLDDLREAAIKLTNDEHYGFAIPSNQLRYGWYPIIRQFGGDILDEDRKNSTIASDPKVKEAVKFMYDAWNTDKYVPEFEAMAGELTVKSHTYFPRQKVAMFYDAFVGTTRNNEAGVNYDVVIQPKQAEYYASFIANSWVLNANAGEAEKEAGWKYMEYYLSEKAQKLHATVADSLPSNKAVMEEMLSDTTTVPANKKAFLDTLEFAGTLAENAVWEEQNKVFQGALEKYLGNEISLDEFIQLADKDLQKVLDDFYKK